MRPGNDSGAAYPKTAPLGSLLPPHAKESTRWYSDPTTLTTC